MEITTLENIKGIEGSEFNKVLAATQKPKFIIIEGRPAAGKTTLGLSIAKTMAVDNNKPVLFFSLEMKNDYVINRLLSMTCSIPLHKIQSGDLTEEERIAINAHTTVLNTSPLYIEDAATLTLAELRSKTQNLVEEKKIALIIIDYLQLMMDDSKTYASRLEETLTITRSLSCLAKEFNVPIIVLSQLGRINLDNGISTEIEKCADKVFRIS